jgi:hypothetical protein
MSDVIHKKNAEFNVDFKNINFPYTKCTQKEKEAKQDLFKNAFPSLFWKIF